LSPAEILEAIRERALEIGFDKIGACTPEIPPEAALFSSWISRGMHGEMAYLVRGAAQRLDPSLLMRGCRSILAGAVRYAPQTPPPSSALSGEVSCYAWGEDYHRVVGSMASSLASFIRARFDARASEYVDTGALLERLWAARAGIGWVGKNAMILDRDLGSYIFLAVILTDLELPGGEPALDQCGACTLCIEACPTGAIVEERTVDSRRCLSYHTIELRGPFPREHVEDLEARVFGCDDCQSVCPWNQAGSEAARPFLPREGIARPDLPALLSMTLPEYTERFRGSAMKRATYAGLRRNAAVALGNVLAGRADRGTGRPSPAPEERERALRALRAAASDPTPGVADAARRALADDV
jgi:epoxyqueuosine reductase